MAGLPAPPGVSRERHCGGLGRPAGASRAARSRQAVYAPSMDSGAIGIFFFRSVPLMNAVLRAADAARAVGRQDLDARNSRKFTHRGRGVRDGAHTAVTAAPHSVRTPARGARCRIADSFSMSRSRRGGP